MGLTPDQFWGLHLWVYNLMVRTRNEQTRLEAEGRFRLAHATAALVAQAFAGTLKGADHYLGGGAAAVADAGIPDEDIERMDAYLEQRRQCRKT